MKAVVDTRFFVVHFLAEDEKTKKKTRRILTDLQREGNKGFVPTMVIHELYKFEYESLGREIAEMRVDVILKSRLSTINLDSSIAIEAAQLRCRYVDLPTADSVIAATAIKTRSDYVLTDDEHIKQIKDVKTKWI